MTDSANTQTLAKFLQTSGAQRTERPVGWESRLIAYLGSNRHRGFRWDTMNCGLFAAGAVEAILGRDPAGPFRGCRTFEEIQAKLNEHGFEDHIDYVAKTFTAIPIAEAMPGDLALTPNRSLGVVQGSSVYQMSPSGLSICPRSFAIRAFAV